MATYTNYCYECNRISSDIPFGLRAVIFEEDRIAISFLEINVCNNHNLKGQQIFDFSNVKDPFSFF